MKKLLLATSALIVTGFSAAAMADTPKVTLGGYLNFEAGYANDDMDNTATASQDGVSERPQAFRNDTQVDVKIDGKSDAFAYGGEVDLLADTTADVQGRGFNASKTFVYLQCAKTGMRLELGSNVGADSTLKVDAGSIAHAALAALTATGRILPTPMNLSSPGPTCRWPMARTKQAASIPSWATTTRENLIKATLYTPRYAGFQAGVSYLPDQTNTGQGYPLWCRCCTCWPQPHRSERGPFGKYLDRWYQLRKQIRRCRRHRCRHRRAWLGPNQRL